MEGVGKIQINREPLATEVVRRVIDLILSNEMSPGDRLPSERSLSEILGVGRSVVREALKSLTVLGLVEVRQGDGTYLSQPESGFLMQAIEWGLLLGAHGARDLVEARCHLEEIITALAAERRSDDDVDELRRLFAEMEASQEDTERFVRADMAFHSRLAAACGNGTMKRMMSGITMLLDVWIHRVMTQAGSFDPTLAEHRRILAAVEAADADAARAAAAAHMTRARGRLERSLDVETVEVPG